VSTVKRQARVAGFLYLVLALTAPIGLLYVPSRIIVSGNASATAEHLRTLGWLVRVGIASELGHQVIQVFLVLALYRLFQALDASRAAQLVILGALVSVPIVFINVLNEIAALLLASGEDFLAPVGGPQREALAYVFMRLHGDGITVASVFWGLWLFPFGRLVVQSKFIPAVLGGLLLLAGCAYLADAFATLIVPSWAGVVSPIARLAEVGELPIVLWLVIWGAREKRAHER
jgi:hypothetical protein